MLLLLWRRTPLIQNTTDSVEDVNMIDAEKNTADSVEGVNMTDAEENNADSGEEVNMTDAEENHQHAVNPLLPAPTTEVVQPAS